MIIEPKINEDVFIPVVGYEDLYSVNQKGEVFSKWKKGLLRSKVSKHGYNVVNLRQKWTLLHRVVATAFLGKSNLHVNHKDGIKTNNHISNLEWCTRAENMQHAFRTGLVNPKTIKRKVRDQHPKAKLNWDQVNEIRAKYIPYKYGCVKLGREYGMDNSTILDIVKFNIWKPVTQVPYFGGTSVAPHQMTIKIE